MNNFFKILVIVASAICCNANAQTMAQDQDGAWRERYRAFDAMTNDLRKFLTKYPQQNYEPYPHEMQSQVTDFLNKNKRFIRCNDDLCLAKRSPDDADDMDKAQIIIGLIGGKVAAIQARDKFMSFSYGFGASEDKNIALTMYGFQGADDAKVKALIKKMQQYRSEHGW